MKARRILAIVLCSIFICIIPGSGVFAHSSSLSGVFDKTGSYYGKESNGWLVNEAFHTNGSYLYYKFAAGIDSDLITLVNNGAGLWGSPFSVQYDTTGSGTVILWSALPSDVIACFYSSNPDSSGHLTSWYLRINPRSECLSHLTSAIIAHEFGHAYGLSDLYSSSNANKLMYAYDDNNNTLTATAPTTSDVWGAKVITGKHSSHSWYYQYAGNSGGHDIHKRICTSCGGFKTQQCTFNASGYCTKCGHHASISPDGMIDPTAALLPNTEDGRRFFPRH